jgi:pimeloyl-ACP methyl ester carboxylesterase
LTHSPQNPGSIKGVPLADNAARVIEILERAKPNGPTVLVAHSRGGITTTAVANARPELIDRIAYVSAWCPVDLDVSDYYAQPETADIDAGAFAATLVGNPAELGLLRTNFRTADPAALVALSWAAPTSAPPSAGLQRGRPTAITLKGEDLIDADQAAEQISLHEARGKRLVAEAPADRVRDKSAPPSSARPPSSAAPHDPACPYSWR